MLAFKLLCQRVPGVELMRSPSSITGTKGFQFSVGWELMVPSWSKTVSSQRKQHAQMRRRVRIERDYP